MTALRRPFLLLAWALIALTLAMRLALPAGWMPVSGVDGIRVEICSGMGLKTVIVDDEGKAHPDAPQPKHDPCPYALASATPFALPAIFVLPLPPATLAAQLLPATYAARLVAWRAMRPPARGPPALA